MPFEPTRAAGLQKLSSFAPKAARDYATGRNYDLPNEGHPHVSSLSPYLRHRLISEQEVIETVLGRFSPSSAEKFVQEVYWRTYWKGWLEQRPQVWHDYKSDVSNAVKRLQNDADLRRDYENACKGVTELPYFNSWVHELVNEGYLHNHARMWFASIWIFSLKLPWQLGADFFLRHLIDGDPASNTLSWRWVAGLQTVGKTYLARPSNIEKYTKGRFSPTQEELASIAEPLAGLPHPAPRTIPASRPIPENARVGFLITEEDMNPGFLLRQKLTPAAFGVLKTTATRSVLKTSGIVTDFIDGGLRDSANRFSDRFGSPDILDPSELDAWAKTHDVTEIVTSYAPTGPCLDALHQSQLQHAQIHYIQRNYDQNAWPCASAGFFKFKKQIPKLINLFR